MENKQNGIIKALTILAYLVMIIVNGLANSLPLNGITTGDVSDAYQNLFAPTGLTFAIWGLIYLLLAGYVLYQARWFRGNENADNIQMLDRVGTLFIISSLANAAWIFTWHYDMIPLSMAFMLVILISLIYKMKTILQYQLSLKEKIFVKLPFSVYFGWITVATIANATVLLVSLNWNGFGIPGATWAVIMIIVGMLIGAAPSIRNRDAAYALVFVWAYYGIYIKHTSVGGFGGQYPAVITTAIICIILMLAVSAYSLIAARKESI